MDTHLPKLEFGGTMKRVLAVASGGGHWEQLMMLRSAFAEHEVRFATTERSVADLHDIKTPALLTDCNKDQPLRALLCLIQAVILTLRVRPQVVVSTGAAPGFFCILCGRLIGAKTLWIDSVANAEALSICGKLSTRVAHQTLTQWEHLADVQRLRFVGSVL